MEIEIIDGCICEWVEKQMGYKNVTCSAINCKNMKPKDSENSQDFHLDFRDYFKLR